MYLRIIYYTRRVKTLKYDHNDSDMTGGGGANGNTNSGPHYYPDRVLHSLGLYRQSRDLFPNLQQLHFRPQSLYELMNLPFLMGSALTLFEVIIDNDYKSDNRAPFYDVSFDDAIEDPLWFLLDLEPQLNTLRVLPMPDVDASMRNTYWLPLKRLIAQSTLLVKVAIIPSPEVMDALSTLPNLLDLEIHVRTLRDPLVGATNSPSDIPTSSFTPFPVLRSLRAEASTLSSLVSVLTGAHCFARADIFIKCEECPKLDEFESFLRIGLHPEISSDLRVFELLSVLGDTVPDETAYAMTLETIRPLFRCTNLHTFTHSTGCPITLEDSDLRTIASSWPKLSSLDLGSTVSEWIGFTTRLTLLGLGYLSHCPMLETLKVIFSVEEDYLERILPHGPSATTCPLTVIVVGPSAIREGLAVATASFLALHFPDLNTIEHDSTSSSRWKEVEMGMHTVRHWAKLLVRD
jgi:hypothetical protein